MPFKSKAQVRKFYAMKNRGEMSQKTIDRWEKHTKKPISELPEKKAFAEGFEDELRKHSFTITAGDVVGGISASLLTDYATRKWREKLLMPRPNPKALAISMIPSLITGTIGSMAGRRIQQKLKKGDSK